ncbi:GAF domain-containing protein [Chitinivorax sp. PXF-14]|uniref:GAF domain-containing protein n=1 Tax=Chitinivorax sp. PXF-14 TaxID=3230488 RepID=UPI0034669FB4
MQNTARLLDKLATITAAVDTGSNQDDKLQELVALAARMLHADYCSIMLLSQEEELAELHLKLAATFGPIDPKAYDSNVRKGEGIDGQVLATGKSLLIEDIERSPYAKTARRRDDPRKSMIASPIMLNGEIIGVINVSGNRHNRPFNIDDQNLLDIAALFIGKSIQVMQLQSALHSRFTQMALAQEQEEGRSPFSPTAVQHPDQMAKLLAKTFYRELAKAGFNPKQIISTATEIIHQLNDNIAKHKKRLDRG